MLYPGEFSDILARRLLPKRLDPASYGPPHASPEPRIVDERIPAHQVREDTPFRLARYLSHKPISQFDA